MLLEPIAAAATPTEMPWLSDPSTRGTEPFLALRDINAAREHRVFKFKFPVLAG